MFLRLAVFLAAAASTVTAAPTASPTQGLPVGATLAPESSQGPKPFGPGPDPEQITKLELPAGTPFKGVNYSCPGVTHHFRHDLFWVAASETTGCMALENDVETNYYLDFISHNKPQGFEDGDTLVCSTREAKCLWRHNPIDGSFPRSSKRSEKASFELPVVTESPFPSLPVNPTVTASTTRRPRLTGHSTTPASSQTSPRSLKPTLSPLPAGMKVPKIPADAPDSAKDLRDSLIGLIGAYKKAGHPFPFDIVS